MKRTDLYRLQGLKIASRIKPHGAVTTPGGAAGVPDKREQRRLDQAAGLIPFACKLNADLVKQLQVLAHTRSVGLNQIMAELLAKALALAQAAEPAPVPAPAPALESAPTPKPKAAPKPASRTKK